MNVTPKTKVAAEVTADFCQCVMVFLPQSNPVEGRSCCETGNAFKKCLHGTRKMYEF